MKSSLAKITPKITFFNILLLIGIMSASPVFSHGVTLADYEGPVVVNVLFPIGDGGKDYSAFVQVLEKSGPKYDGLDGLIRKYYLVTGDNTKAGGVYFWESIDKANAWFTPEWFDYIKTKFGESPSVEYFKAPVIVNN